MRHFKIAALLCLPAMLMALAGCGSSGSTSSKDPLAPPNNSNIQQGGTIFGNVSTVTGKTGISLSADRPSVDVVNGQVLLTARVLSSGSPVSGATVTFGIVAPVNGPATIESGLTTVRTDSTGAAMTRVTTGNTPSTTNVIVSASVQVGGQTAITNTSFQIVRGGGVIMFTPNAGTGPGGQSNILPSVTAEVKAAEGSDWYFYQLLPFKLTDSNGNPRVGIPVTISVYSINSHQDSDVDIDFLVSSLDASQQTIVTDSAGQGVFNARIKMVVPAPEQSYAVTSIYKAVTNEPLPVSAYLGGNYQLTAKASAPVAVSDVTISPAIAYFGNGSLLNFTITGGTPPYTVVNANPATITTTLQPDGKTVLVTLLDATSWTGSVSFSVFDTNGKPATTAPTIFR